MDKKRLRRLADYIEQHKVDDLGFQMETYATEGCKGPYDRSGHDCDTVACIAGHGWMLALGYKKLSSVRIDRMNEDAFEVAKNYLDLTYDEASEMFLMRGYNGWRQMSAVTPEEAAKLLRYAAETGTVDWRFAFGETP